MQSSPADFFADFRSALSSQTSISLTAFSILVDSNTASAFAQYAVRMNTSSADIGALESAFSSAVQSGLVESALQQALGTTSVSVLAAEPVQAQRLAVTVALGLATRHTVDSAFLTQCANDEKMAKEWYAVGIAFVIAFGVSLIACCAGFAGYKIGSRLERTSSGMPPGKPAGSPGEQGSRLAALQQIATGGGDLETPKGKGGNQI